MIDLSKYYMQQLNVIIDFFSCFFSQPGVMFGVFLGPLFSTVLFIVVMFILTTRVLLRHRRRKFFAGLLKTTTRTLVGAATVTVLFGLTWVFGAVAFTGGPDIFLWLFIFFNSLQGVFFCVFQKDAQDAWILLIRYGGKCSICRKRKEAAGENGTLKPTAGPAATFVSVPSVEFTVEERFDNGGILSLEGTLKYVCLLYIFIRGGRIGGAGGPEPPPPLFTVGGHSPPPPPPTLAAL